MQLPAISLEHAVELVRSELRARKGKWRELAAAAQGKVTWRWILTFAAHAPNPHIENVVALARVMELSLPPVLLTGVPSPRKGGAGLSGGAVRRSRSVGLPRQGAVAAKAR